MHLLFVGQMNNCPVKSDDRVTRKALSKGVSWPYEYRSKARAQPPIWSLPTCGVAVSVFLFSGVDVKYKYMYRSSNQSQGQKLLIIYDHTLHIFSLTQDISCDRTTQSPT